MSTIHSNIKALEAIIDFSALIQKINLDRSAIEQNANRVFSYSGAITPEFTALCNNLNEYIENAYKNTDIKQMLDIIKNYIPATEGK